METKPGGAVEPKRAEPAQLPGACVRDRWLDDLWPDPARVAFRPTTLEERSVFATLVPRLLEAAPTGKTPPADLVSLAATVGFELVARIRGSDTVWILREHPHQQHGAGAYVFRTGPASADVIEAPHAYHDIGTGALGAALFSCGVHGVLPRAFLTNTAHRYKGRPGERRADRDHPADVAHNPEHLFSTVTDLLARHLHGLRVIQLHGFGAAEVPVRVGVAAVVSAGKKAPTPWARQIHARLAGVLGAGVRLYPEQTAELGATQNAQGRLLQAYPGTSFIHVELSAHSRRLLEHPAELQRFAQAVLAPGEE